MSPFQSKAQISKFLILEKSGKIPTGTTRKWLSETPNLKKLPKHKKNIKSKAPKKSNGRKSKKTK